MYFAEELVDDKAKRPGRDQPRCGHIHRYSHIYNVEISAWHKINALKRLTS